MSLSSIERKKTAFKHALFASKQPGTEHDDPLWRCLTPFPTSMLDGTETRRTDDTRGESRHTHSDTLLRPASSTASSSVSPPTGTRKSAQLKDWSGALDSTRDRPPHRAPSQHDVAREERGSAFASRSRLVLDLCVEVETDVDADIDTDIDTDRELDLALDDNTASAISIQSHCRARVVHIHRSRRVGRLGPSVAVGEGDADADAEETEAKGKAQAETKAVPLPLAKEEAMAFSTPTQHHPYRPHHPHHRPLSSDNPVVNAPSNPAQLDVALSKPSAGIFCASSRPASGPSARRRSGSDSRAGPGSGSGSACHPSCHRSSYQSSPFSSTSSPSPSHSSPFSSSSSPSFSTSTSTSTPTSTPTSPSPSPPPSCFSSHPPSSPPRQSTRRVPKASAIALPCPPRQTPIPESILQPSRLRERAVSRNADSETATSTMRRWSEFKRWC